MKQSSKLKKLAVKRVIEELQKMLVEEKTAGELKARKLLDERARLEESVQDLRKLYNLAHSYSNLPE